MMYCSKCGKEMADTAKFCAVCGTPVAEKQQPEQSPVAEAQDKGNRTKQMIGFGIAFAAVIAAGGLLFYVVRNTDREKQDDLVVSETIENTDRQEQEDPVISEPQSSEPEDVSEPETVINTGFVVQEGELYYYDADGGLVKGWFEENGSRYYAAEEGWIYRNGAYEIDAILYTFDENGICVGDEKTFAEEDARLLQIISGQGNLAQLMEVLAHTYIGSGSIFDSTIVSAEVQANLNRVLNGEPEEMKSLFEGDMPAAGLLRYTADHMPSDYESLYQQYYKTSFLTEEQVEYLIYSICGKQVDIDISRYDGWHEPYLGFGSEAGDISWSELRNFSVERIDVDTWQVRVDDYYGEDWLFPDTQDDMEIVAKVCFTVIENPDSYFEGYSIVGAEVELIDHGDKYIVSEDELAPNGIISNGISYFTNNDAFEAALTQEQYDQWGEIVGPNLYSQFGGQLYFEGFDGVVLSASSPTAGITVTYSNGWTAIVIANY